MTEQNSFLELSEKLENLDKIILSQWEKLVLKSLDNHKKENKIILQDHMPEIIHSLSETLKVGSGNNMDMARAHGFQRALLTSFTIEDLLNEYSIFRETLITYVYPIGDLECVKFVHRYIDNLAQASVIEFIHNIQLSSRLVAPDPESHLNLS
jgi:hypothetical protein